MSSPVPQTILDALSKLQSDADDASVAQSDAEAAAVALASAVHLDETARSTVVGVKAQLKADAQAAVNLIQSTYGV